MCGIVGIISNQINSNKEYYSSCLVKGLEAIERRGPDGQGIWSNDQVLLGHVRLAIIDPNSRSNQPMESENWVLCYNGEVYNYLDIRAELLALGHHFKTNSDTEVVLRSLEQWGVEGCLLRIAGMFAFLAVNKTTGMKYGTRDHMGIKPFLYSQDKDGTFYFGSSVTSIVKMLGNKNLNIDTAALGSYIALGAVHGEHSVYKEIKKLMPAHYVKIDPHGNAQFVRYWEPQYQRNFDLGNLISISKEYQISDVRSALFLSGGVDSSFLASIYEEAEYFHLTSPEQPYAQMVSDRFHGKLVNVQPVLETYDSDVEAAIAFHGEPLMSVGIPLAICRELKNSGYKMAISANGADELFLGYSRTPHPEYKPPYLPLHERKSNQFLLQQLQHIFRDGRNFTLREFDGFVPSMEDFTLECISKYYLNGFPSSASYRWVELMTYVLSDLNPTLDAASMFNGVEVRVPFLDHRIVQGVLSWDSTKLITPELGRKAPLKRHLAKYFPQTLYQRAKVGFSIHPEKLLSITKLSEDALADSVKTNKIVFSSKTVGEYERDVIYLGSTIYGLDKWKKSIHLK